MNSTIRTLLKRPGFSLVAIITLALGIGANTAIFSVVNAVLLKSLPYPQPEELCRLYETSKEVPLMSVAYPNYQDWRAQQTVFEDLAAWMPAGGVFTGDAEPERVIGRFVSPSFLPTLGIQPKLGRAFTEDDDRPGAEAVIILGHGLWQRRFGGDPALVGSAITYNSEKWTVVGILPAEFDFYGADNPNNDFFIPLGRLSDQPYMKDRHSHPVQVAARLRTGVAIYRARVEMSTIAARLQQDYPVSNTGNGVDVHLLVDDYVGETRPALLVISGAVALLLLIACANVANLLLVRASGRRKEIAIRMALGAGRLTVMKQLMAESVILAVVGGGLGVLLAVWGLELLVNLNPDALPRAEEISIDWRVLSFALFLSLLTGIIFGLAPALQSSKADLIVALKQGGLQGSGAVAGKRLRSALVVGEVALSLILLIGAALLIKSFRELMEVDPGFDARNVLTLRLRLPDARYREASQTTSFLTEVKSRVAALPGVDDVSITTGFPLGPGRENGYWIEGEPQPRQPGDWPVAINQSVDENYYETMGIGLLTGRPFSARDTADSPPVVIVDEDFRQRHFPDRSVSEVLGKRLRFGGEGEPWREIVGVVRHVRHYGLDEERRAQIYRPWLQMNPRWLAEFTRAMDMVIKTSVDPTSLVASIKQEVQMVDKDQPLANVRTLEFLLDRSLAPRRFSLLLISVFAITALILGCVGLYGVMSYTVSQSTREIGIRMALGAAQSHVMRQVLGQGLKLTVTGLVIGIAGSFAFTRLMEELLFGVSPTDLMSFGSVSLLLAAVALLACYFPARRATRVSPSVALRCE